MTTVRLPSGCEEAATGVAGKMLLAVLVGLLLTTAAAAQQQPVHRLYHPALPPGAIGSQRLVANGPLSGYIQPVEIRGPEGTQVAISHGGGLEEPQPLPLLVGMNIGPVYRLRVTNIPFRPGVEVYPTLEIVDRLHPPVGKALEFPIPVELTEEDLLLASGGYLVTRVIYVEDPDRALPVQSDPLHQNWLDAPRGQDPFTTALELGRPVAILRIGSRIPDPLGADGHMYSAPPVTFFERSGHVQP
jgi:hypothetical protein